ncbi:MAG TPA: SpoIID/LytB domain-containing protein, partial [Anaeromyxobacteraceae bacterium]|nr:SpoIID/LytB domain-containing protein [Anaeromyxobacteraceae bacterium]
KVEVRAGAGAGELRVDGRRWPAPVAVFGADATIRADGRELSRWVEVRRTRAGLAVVEVLPMEDYVAGVVSGETPTSFPPEARKAQAVAARTFALVRKLEAVTAGRGWDLGATVISQVFVGAGAADAGAREAAAATAGEVLVLNQEPVETYFHSSCGGRTEDGLAALGRGYEYLSSVPCGRCDGAPGALWRQVIPAEELGRAAGLGRAATSVTLVDRTRSGRAARVEVVAGKRRVTLTGSDLRRRLGYTRLRSLAIEVEEVKGGFAFAGRGSGHGAGLCQWGAAGFAREGKGYREILTHYYPGTEIAVMY